MTYDIHKVQLSNGCEVAYIDEGSGAQTILFVHGLATYARSWKKQIESLKDKYRCIAIDLPGNGKSDRGDYPYSMNFFAGCVYDFIQKLRLTNVVLAGHSMGGQVVMNLLINLPSAAEKLILFAPAGFETFNGMERSLYQSSISFLDMFSTEENSLRRTIRSSFYQYPPHVDEMIEELVALMKIHSIREYRAMIEACVAGMLHEPVFNQLHLIQQPTLVMYGERDALIPNRLIHPVNTRTIGEAGVAQMPHAQLQMIPRCGHFLQLEKPAEVNSLVREFLG
ncbi:MAG TPA: alpha/beta hydrolase [Flavipsychrobacter sp.]